MTAVDQKHDNNRTPSGRTDTRQLQQMVKQEVLVDEVGRIDPKHTPDQSYFNSDKKKG